MDEYGPQPGQNDLGPFRLHDAPTPEPNPEQVDWVGCAYEWCEFESTWSDMRVHYRDYHEPQEAVDAPAATPEPGDREYHQKAERHQAATRGDPRA